MDDLSHSAANPSEDQQPSGSQLPLRSDSRDASAADSSPQAELGIEPNPSPSSPPTLIPAFIDDPPWQLADLGAFVLFAIFTFLLANVAATAMFLLVRRGMGWNLRAEDALLQTPYIVFMQVFWEVLWFLFIYYTVAIKYRRPFWPAIRWARPQRSATSYFLGGILLAAAAQGLLNLLPSEKELPIERLFTSAASSYLLAMFGICVAPFIEELVFRGFFYPVFERSLGFLRAVLLTALLFAIIHGPQLNGGWAEMTAIYLVGVTLSYVRGKTGSLVPSYLMHLAYNTTLFISLYLTTDRFHALKG